MIGLERCIQKQPDKTTPVRATTFCGSMYALIPRGDGRGLIDYG